MEIEHAPARWRHAVVVLAAAVTFLCLTLASASWYIFYAAEVLHISRGVGGVSAIATGPLTESAPNASDRLIVAARFDESLDWTEWTGGIPVKVIEKLNPLNPDNLGTNRFSEASSYLYYVVKYYDALPAIVAFVHGHGDSGVLRPEVWNVTGYKALAHDTLETTNTQHERERGFLTWIGDRGFITLIKDPPPTAYDRGETDVPEPGQRAFHLLFAFLRAPWEAGGMGMSLPHFSTTLCCSTFSVPRAAIRSVPRDRYQRLFEYLESDPEYKLALHDAFLSSPPDRRRADDDHVNDPDDLKPHISRLNAAMGIAMEYVWIVWFSEEGWA